MRISLLACALEKFAHLLADLSSPSVKLQVLLIVQSLKDVASAVFTKSLKNVIFAC